MNQQIYTAIEQQFKKRIEAARQQGEKLKPGSAAYIKKQAEFFTGAMAALVAVVDMNPAQLNNELTKGEGPEAKQRLHGKAMPPSWVFSIMRGDDIIAENETNSSTKKS